MNLKAIDGLTTELANHVFVVDILPNDVGVLPGEVGKPGPWYGVRMPDGSDYGWYLAKTGAEQHAAAVWKDYIDSQLDKGKQR